MSLQVWLPLNGNLNNNGLANVTVTNNGATVDNTGKFGKCYNFNGNSNISIDNLTLGNTWSYGCWFKSAASTRGWEGLVIYNLNGGDPDMQLGFYTYPAASRLQTTANGEYNSGISHTYDGIWHHLFATFDGSLLKTYRDGVLINTKSITAGLLSRSKLTLGARCRGSSYDCYFNGQITDFRLYDECLSEQQIRELSMGLALHYKLDDKYAENATNIEIHTGETLDCSGVVLREFGDFFGRNCWHIKIKNSGTGWYGSYSSFSGFAQGTTLTRSCMLYIPSGQPNTYGWYGCPFAFENCTTLAQKNYDFQKFNTWQHCYQTATATSTSSNFLYYFIVASGGTSELEFYITDMQFEVNDHATPYVPSSRVNNKVYDSSGFGNHGTINGSLKISTNTMRYSASSEFNSTSISYANCLCNSQQEWTCCAWVYPMTNTGLLNNMNHGNYLYYNSTQPLLYLNSGSNDYYTYGTSNCLTLNAWNFVVYVFRNSDGLRKIYVNGIDKSAGGPNLTYTPSGIPSTVVLGQNFRGYMSDYRVYATALSEQDIRYLYETSCTVDNAGNFYAREVVED